MQYACRPLVVSEHGVVLAGPDPSTLVDPVPIDQLRREILAQPEHYDNRF